MNVNIASELHFAEQSVNSSKLSNFKKIVIQIHLLILYFATEIVKQ